MPNSPEGVNATRRTALGWIAGAAAAGAGLGVSLGACQSAAPISGVPTMTFAHLAPIRLNVGERQIVEMPSAGGVVGLGAPVPVTPREAITRWAEQRFQPVGYLGRVEIVMFTASIADIPLARSDGLDAVFRVEQSEQYQVNMDVQVSVSGLPNTSPGAVRAQVERTRTVPEDVTLQERDEVAFALVEDAMAALDAELAAQIQASFGPYLAG